MSTEEIIDAQVVEEEGHTTELTVAPQNSATLFRTDDPVQVLSRATEVANALSDVIEQRNLYSIIRQNKHVKVEGWLTLGSMLGVTPICTWTRQLDNGWEARVEARTLDGRVIGAAEAQCLKAEKRWGAADDYAVRSMAQTRATSKALGSVLRFVVTLAGYEGTPAEEMPSEPARQEQAKPEPAGPQLDPERVNRIIDTFQARTLRIKDISLLLGAVGIDAPRAKSRQAVIERIEGLTEEQATALEDEMGKGVEGE